VKLAFDVPGADVERRFLAEAGERAGRFVRESSSGYSGNVAPDVSESIK
jgi:hypothetical protein